MLRGRIIRKAKRSGSFLTVLLINMLLNFSWSIPAWVLLGLHFWLNISVWWFVAGLVFWIVSILIGMKFIGWATDCGNRKDPVKENKNPYSEKRKM